MTSIKGKTLKNVRILFVPAMFILTACHSNLPTEGHYSGTRLDQNTNGLISKHPISGDLKKSDRQTYLFALTDDADRSPAGEIGLELKDASHGSLSLVTQNVQTGVFSVHYSEGCWRDTNESVHLCVKGDEVTLAVHDDNGQDTWSMDVRLSQAPVLPAYETPKLFSLNEAMTYASQMSFDSRIEYEHVLQARYATKAAYLNLLPHFNLSDSGNCTSISGLTSAIGDLAPFLLPSRWIAAKNTAIDAGIESDIDHLMKMSVAAQVEGLTYQLKRDQGIVALYNYLIGRAQNAQSQVLALEQKGTFPQGSAAHLQAVQESMRLDLSSFEDVIVADRAALSQALGFFNPETVLDITLDSEVQVGQMHPLSQEDSTTFAIQHSLEIDEIARLKQIANNQRKALYFNWLDPSGDSSENLGFNLGEQFQISRSKTNELQVRMEQIESGIAQNVFGYVQSFNTSISVWSDLEANVSLQEERLNRVMTDVTPNSGLNTLDIEGILVDYLSAGVRKEQTLAEFRIAGAQINRALYQGAYSQF
jgi:hypothetical protein